MSAPRIGRAGRPPWTEGDFKRFRGYHGLTGPPAVTRLLAAPVPVDTPAPKARRPRMSTSERLAALLAQRGCRPLRGCSRRSVPPTLRRPPERPAWSEVQQRAQQPAEALKPLPEALDEVAKRISRHCAVAGRDAELARVVDAVRQRTWDLWRGIDRLAEAAQGRGVMARRGDGIYSRGRTWWLDFTHDGRRHQVRLGKDISRTVAGELAPGAGSG